MTEELKELKKINKNLEEISVLLQQVVIINLYISGATQTQIAKNLGVSKGTVNSMVKGVKRNEV